MPKICQKENNAAEKKKAGLLHKVNSQERSSLGA